MSGEKKAKVIQVDKLIIHAKEVELNSEKSNDDREDRRHPFDFFGLRRRPERTQPEGEHQEEHQGEHQRESGDRVEEESGERPRGPRWV